MSRLDIEGLAIFSTCPHSRGIEDQTFRRWVTDVARWSDRAGCRGMLIYTDNSTVDPWLVSQLVLQLTEQLCPLVAVQPLYMHPYTAAKIVSSLAYLHGRRVFLNMVAGGFTNDLAALNDHMPHDERYDRVVEYTLIVQRLLQGEGPVSFQGAYYRVTNLRMIPPLPAELMPGICISGSSPAGLAAARALGATAVKYPQPVDEEHANEYGDVGIRVGVLARATAEEAWSVARRRFPEDRRGQITHALAMKVSDSHWHRQLGALGQEPPSEKHPYWLVPFKNYKTFCPYLVGSYERVGQELSEYVARGFTTFILDIPPSEEELYHTAEAFRMALQRGGPTPTGSGIEPAVEADPAREAVSAEPSRGAAVGGAAGGSSSTEPPLCVPEGMGLAALEPAP
jgi:alkanesulfonate monooxygenase